MGSKRLEYLFSYHLWKSSCGLSSSDPLLALSRDSCSCIYSFWIVDRDAYRQHLHQGFRAG